LIKARSALPHLDSFFGLQTPDLPSTDNNWHALCLPTVGSAAPTEMDLFAGGNPDEDMIDVEPWLTVPERSGFDDTVDSLFSPPGPSISGAQVCFLFVSAGALATVSCILPCFNKSVTDTTAACRLVFRHASGACG
jgi:hypothetical protein